MRANKPVTENPVPIKKDGGWMISQEKYSLTALRRGLGDFI